MNGNQDDAARSLVEKAERRMRDGVGAEIEAAKMGAFHSRVDAVKYEEAKAMFESALQLEPGNQRAVAGIADCDEMLRGYVPVQYMVPVGGTIDPERLLRVEGDPLPGPAAPQAEKMPWELMRERRQRDREGLAYTGAAFGKAEGEARALAADIVDRAVARAKREPRSAPAIHDAAVAELGELQERLDRGWKGHGPAVRDAALARLEAAFEALGR